MPVTLPFWEKILLFWAFLHIAGPIVLKLTFRFASKVEPVKVYREAVPMPVQGVIDRWATQIQGLGFAPVGVYSLGELASNTQSYLAYFLNRTAGDFADISVIVSKGGTKGYFEFTSSFSDGSSLETNVNKIPSVGAVPPDMRIFRFPELSSPRELYQIHRALIQKYAGFVRPQLPAEGEEATRIVRQMGRFAPCQVQAGYMRLAADGTHYRMTWKGAFLMTWKSIWPTTLVRRSLFAMRMQKELKSLQGQGITNVRTA